MMSLLATATFSLGLGMEQAVPNWMPFYALLVTVVGWGFCYLVVRMRRLESAFYFHQDQPQHERRSAPIHDAEEK